MDAWVEQCTAPDKLVAIQFAPDITTPVAQRPVCEYPQFPPHNGTGDPAKVESFTCSASCVRPVGFTAPGVRPAGAPGARRAAGLQPGWDGWSVSSSAV